MSYDWENPKPFAWENQEDPEAYWNRKVEETRRRGKIPTLSPGSILLGRNSADWPIGINSEILRTHMHVLGATDVGKSFFLEGIIKNLILQGHGVCLIDPHGDLYHRVLDFCAYASRACPNLGLQNRVIPFDIAESRQFMGFNPVQRNARIKVYQVVALMEAVRKCWGQGSFQQTPRLARWLFNTLYAVVDSETTFLQTYNMVNPLSDDLYRQAITGRIKSPHIRAEWETLSRMKPDRREERVESCLNRIRPFVEHDTIRRTIGQYKNTINFDDVLSGQKVFLVNLGRQNVISADDQHLFGTLLLNELITAAFARREGERTPYFCFIDEFQKFVTKDICEILDGGRKFGLHLILAHQHLAQLREQDPEVYFSTMTNARTKVVFGGLIDQDLQILGKEFYTGELDPDEVKDEIWQTKFRPVESTRLIVSHSKSYAESSGSVEISHQSLAENATYIAGSSMWSTDPVSTGVSEVSATGTAESVGSSHGYGRTKTEVPFYEQHKFRELSSRTFRSLEEQLYIKTAQMKRQSKQHAAILIPGQRVELVKTPTIKEISIPYSFQQEFKGTCFAAAGCFKGPEEVDGELRELEESLLLGGEVVETEERADHDRDDEEFLQ